MGRHHAGQWAKKFAPQQSGMRTVSDYLSCLPDPANSNRDNFVIARPQSRLSNPETARREGLVLVKEWEDGTLVYSHQGFLRV